MWGSRVQLYSMHVVCTADVNTAETAMATVNAVATFNAVAIVNTVAALIQSKIQSIAAAVSRLLQFARTGPTHLL